MSTEENKAVIRRLFSQHKGEASLPLRHFSYSTSS
jgi:hypothetical protein